MAKKGILNPNIQFLLAYSSPFMYTETYSRWSCSVTRTRPLKFYINSSSQNDSVMNDNPKTYFLLSDPHKVFCPFFMVVPNAHCSPYQLKWRTMNAFVVFTSVVIYKLIPHDLLYDQLLKLILNF